MQKVIDVLFSRALWIGIALGAIAGGVLVWRLDPRSFPAMNLDEARRASQMGKWDIVQGIVGRHLRRYPEDLEAQVLYARSLAAQGDAADCLEKLEKIPDSTPWGAEARLREAQVYFLNYQGRRSEQRYRRTIELAAHDRADPLIVTAARVGLAQLCAQESRVDEARAQLTRVLATPSDRAAILAALLEVEVLGQEPNQAIESLKRFIDNDPEDFEARRALGHYYMVLGKTAEARELLENCLREQPDHLLAAQSLAYCLLEIPDVAACRRLLDDASPGADQQAWYWRVRGYLAEQDQTWPDAVDCYERAVRLAPRDPVVHHLLATALGRLDESDRAAEHLQREAELKKASQNLFELYGRLASLGTRLGGPGPDADLCYLIGVSCQTLHLPEAADWFREALARQPGHAPSLKALGQIEADASSGAGSESQDGSP